MFGMKLAGVTPLNGATVTGPTGSPAGITVELRAAIRIRAMPITFTFTLPDGSDRTADADGHQHVAARARASSRSTRRRPIPPTNLQAALTGAVGKLAATSLSAASAMAAANNFFNVDAGQPPMRVAGPPFDTATTLVAGTSANTVTWYTGEMGTDLARGTAVAKVDDALTVSYGARANEQALRSTIANIAVYAVDDVLVERSECAGPLHRDERSASALRLRCRTASRRCRTSRPSSPSRRPR